MNKHTANAVTMANKAITILIERGKSYDNNNNLENDAHAKIMQILYPNGLSNNIDNIIEYKYVSQIVDKLCRYRLNMKQDNLLDLANYAFLLAASDEEVM
jgi:hypothetical protein